MIFLFVVDSKDRLMVCADGVREKNWTNYSKRFGMVKKKKE
jgi:hypothetical protein